MNGQPQRAAARSDADPATAVCVVIPCFNDRGYLVECLDSLRRQTSADWEAVVVDDASTVGDPGRVLRELGDARIRLLRHDRNRGLGAARNSGIRSSSAGLVMPVDADDKLAPTCIEQLSGRLLQDPSVNVVYPDFYYFGAEEGRLRMPLRDVRSLLRRQWIPGPGVIFRRSLWEDVGGYAEEDALLGNEDWDFWLAAAEVGLAAGHVPEPLYLYRRHRATLSSTHLARVDYAMRRRLYERHRQLFDRHGSPRPFLAEGYRRSALDAWRRRDIGRTLLLGSVALRLAPLASLREARRLLR